MKRLWYILPLLFILSCEDKKDTTPPETTITSPAIGSTVNEMVTVTCMSTDNSGVEKVELWIDGVNTSLTDDTEPYSFKWNTTTYKDGNHTLVVRSYDTNGNEGDSAPLNVKVDNSISVPKGVSIQSAEFSNGGFTIKWSKSTDGDFKSYTLEHSVEPQMNDYEEIFSTEDVNATNTRMENTSPLTYHYFRVTVTDTFLYKTKGTIFTSKLDPIPDSVDVKSVTYDFEKMTVEWNKSSESDFGNYKLLYSKTESGDRDIVETYSDKTTTTYSTTTYDPTIENWYWVMVTDTLAQSKTGNGKTNTLDAPPTATEIDSTTFDGSTLYVYWTPNTDADFKSLTVFESENENMSNSTVLFSSEDQSLYRADSYNHSLNILRYYQIEVEDIWGQVTKSGIIKFSTYEKIFFLSGASNRHQIGYKTLDGSNRKIFDNPPRVYDSESFIFSNDGEYIFYLSNERKIFKLNVSSQIITQLTNNNVNYSQPKINSDDSKIVFFEQGVGIVLYDINSNSEVIIKDAGGSPIFSPNEQKILFWYNDGDGGDLYTTDYDGNNLTNLTENVIGRIFSGAFYTPDGSRIIAEIENDNSSSGTNEIIIINSDGSSYESLLKYSELNLSQHNGFDFSPDGTKLMYGYTTKANKAGILSYDFPSKTYTTTHIEDSPQIKNYPRYSNDGSKITYYSYDSNNQGIYEIYVVNADGTNKTNITNSPASEIYPQFQPRP